MWKPGIGKGCPLCIVLHREAGILWPFWNRPGHKSLWVPGAPSGQYCAGEPKEMPGVCPRLQDLPFPVQLRQWILQPQEGEVHSSGFPVLAPCRANSRAQLVGVWGRWMECVQFCFTSAVNLLLDLRQIISPPQVSFILSVKRSLSQDQVKLLAFKLKNTNQIHFFVVVFWLGSWIKMEKGLLATSLKNAR